MFGRILKYAWLRQGLILGLVVAPPLVLLGSGLLASLGGASLEDQRLVAEAIADAVGLGVEVGQLERTSSQTIRLRSLRLFDPEHGALVAEIGLAEAVRQKRNWQVTVHDVHLHAANFQRTRGLLHDAVLRRSNQSRRVRVIAHELTWLDESRPQSLVEWVLDWNIDSKQRELLCEFAMPGDSQRRVRCTWTRSRSSGSHSTQVQLASQAELPGWLLASLLGLTASDTWAECSFRGRIAASREAGKLNGRVQGRFSHCQLDDWVTRFVPHKLSGQAEILVSDLALRNGRLVSATGVLRATDGTVSVSLLQAMATLLGIQLPDRVQQEREKSVGYGELKFAFELEHDHLEIQGTCGDMPAGTWMRDQAGPLLRMPHRTGLSMLALLQQLSSREMLTVPMTRGTSQLLNVLSLPVDHATRSDQPGYVPLRLHRH